MAKRAYIIKAVLLLGFIPFFILTTMSSVTAGEDSSGPWIDYKTLKEKQQTIPGYNKVSSSLNTVVNQIKARGVTKQNASEPDASILSNPMVKVNEKNSIQTYIHVYTFGDEERALLESYEVVIEVVNEKHKIIQAWIPFDRLYEVAQLAFVKKITPPNYGTPRVGSVTTEGDIILRAAELRTAEGLDGTGVKVGAISDGVDNRATAEASGDLPAGGITIQTHAGGGDEGTAMLEIIHDLAPGAELGFCGPLTSLEMIACVNDLADPTKFGADIVVDDLGFILEPYFEDGPIAQAVAGVLPTVIYASSAGNSALDHYQGNFVGTVLHFSYPEHNFGIAAGGASDTTMNVLVYPGVSTFVLQWNDPFGGSGNDYDLVLTDEAESGPLFFSAFTQDGDDDPLEIVQLNNSGSVPVRLKVIVPRFSGTAAMIKLFCFGAVVVEEFSVPQGSIFGHPAVLGVLATGAIDASDPAGNAVEPFNPRQHDTIEPFSSCGPVEIFHPIRETRQKPDVAAIDGVSVTGAGGFPSTFFGTSAAAPHVAGAAALLKETGYGNDLVQNALKHAAVDLGDPGFDNKFGFGRIDAVAAHDHLKEPGTWATAASNAVLANMNFDSATANAVYAYDDPAYYPLVALYASASYDFALDAYMEAAKALAAAGLDYTFWGYYAVQYAQSDIDNRYQAVTYILLASQYAAAGDLVSAAYYGGLGMTMLAAADLYNGTTIWCASMESSGQAAAQQSSATSQLEPYANGSSSFANAAAYAVLANMNFDSSLAYAVFSLNDPSYIPLVQLYAQSAYDLAEDAYEEATAALAAAGQDYTFWGYYAPIYAESDITTRADAVSAFDQAVLAYQAGDLATALDQLGFGILYSGLADLYNGSTIWCASMESAGGAK